MGMHGLETLCTLRLAVMRTPFDAVKRMQGNTCYTSNVPTGQGTRKGCENKKIYVKAEGGGVPFL